MIRCKVSFSNFATKKTKNVSIFIIAIMRHNLKAHNLALTQAKLWINMSFEGGKGFCKSLFLRFSDE